MTPSTAPSPEPARQPRRPRPSTRLLPALALAALAALATTPAQAEPTAPPGPAEQRAGTVAGLDVSGHQPQINWNQVKADGARFAFVKATEGTGFRSGSYTAQWNGARAVGLLTGAYHFALPDRSSGAAQANYFADHGGTWTPDGRTLPGVLDIENNPYGADCYGLAPHEMSQWLQDFSNTYNARTGRHPMIYTNAAWWNKCTGANPGFAGNSPLWIARYGPEVGELPAGWTNHTVWQHGTRGAFPGGQDVFNGSPAQLTALARG
ncbi:lysozyme [Salinifilum ghardaiensis]